MLRPKKMKRARVIVLKASVESLIKDLHEAGLVDITKTKYGGLEEGRPLASFDDISGQLLRLRSILTLMEPHVDMKKLPQPEAMEGQKALAEMKKLDVEERLRSLTQEATALSEQVRELESKALVIDRVLHFGSVDFSRLGTRKLGYRVGEITPVAKVKEELERIGDTSVVSKSGSNIILVLYDRKDEAAVDSALADAGFNQIEIPEGTTTPFETINKLNAENEAKKTRLEAVKKDLAAISRVHINRIRSLIRSLDIEAQRAEVTSRFASSKYAYVVEGWIVADEYGKLGSIVEKYGSDAMLEDAKFGHEVMPPTVLDNPKVAAPFEFITSSYSLPNYFELDPSMAYFLGLPILYAMIVGDVLYGVMSLLIAMWLMKKFEKSYIMSNVSKLWFYSAFPTMLFGIIFDEWGGMSHYHLLEWLGAWLGTELVHGPLYSGFHRMENILTLVAITALIGFVHLGIGFALGAINEWHHSKKHAMAKIAWIGVEAGGLLALLGGIGLISQVFMPAGLAVVVLSVIALGMTEGVVGVIELPGLLGNILSYTRIAAIGVAGIVIAELVNQALKPMPSQGLLAIIFIPLFIGLHALNCFIAMFESLIQGGRLNIVEFKSKFMHGGGVEFNPFSLHSTKEVK